MNRVIGASRRYLKFLMYQGIYPEGSLQMMVNETNKRDQREGKILPGELPDWPDIASYLSRVEPGYFRWLLLLCAAFGVRISEAFAAVPANLIGKTAILKEKNTFVASMNDRQKPVAFLHVAKAEKVKAKNKNVAAQLGEADDDPKSGPYYAACLSFELGQMIADAMKRGEHNRPDDFTLHSVKNWIEKLPRDETPVLFHEWKTHDFRRCHVTLSALAWGSFGDVAEAHGQASELTARRYFQWGLAMKRSEEKVEFELNI